jgi:hypothetical protein
MGPALGWGQLFEQLEKSLSALGLRGVPKKQAGYAGFFITDVTQPVRQLMHDEKSRT